MKILHALRGLEATSGISTFVVELCNHQVKAGHQVCFIYQRSLEHGFAPEVLVLQESELGRLGWKPDVVHIHAIWTPFSVRMLRWCARNSIPYIVSPHGCLMPRVLQKGKFKKWIFLNLLLRPLLNKAGCWHCTSEAEASACRTLGFTGTFKVIPIGCNIPEIGGVKSNTVLFLGRISEEKGLRFLLDSWKGIDSKGWTLKIAGPDWFGEQRILEEKISRESISNVHFVGVADAQFKDALYREAKVFVLPSPAENFSIVVLDALAYGVPVICTQGTPWKYVEENRCGWWVESNSSKAIGEALMDAMALSDEDAKEMGERARKLAGQHFAWNVVCKSVISAYRDCL